MDVLQLTLPPDGDASASGREWLVTNGLGGYASGGVTGRPVRRHDGLLVAALDAPRGRTVMLDNLGEALVLPNGTVDLFDLWDEIRLEDGLPVWRFDGEDRVIERRIVMPHGQNTTLVVYRLLQGRPVTLALRPWIHVRHADWDLDQPLVDGQVRLGDDGRVDIALDPWPVLRLALSGGQAAHDFSPAQARHVTAVYPIETGRGFLDHGPLWSPGVMTITLDQPGVWLTASTEDWTVAQALSGNEAVQAEHERRRRLLQSAHPALRQGAAGLLTLAADAFVFQPRNRPELKARVTAEGDGLCSTIAGYPWFNDWGRDTMIGLEGLTLITGRYDAARDILRTFARYLKDGLIPDNIPDGPWPPVYHTADATLWFFHAIDRYVTATGDSETLLLLLPRLRDVLACHREGTAFGIRVDPTDGLLRAEADGYQLTWMDAIVDDWVVTPRRGKPVEINALWYNALCVMARWLAETGDRKGAARLSADAERVQDSFNHRFWYGEGGYLYDVIDGDPAESPLFRPNQLFALSLPNPVLDRVRWKMVMRQVRDRLLTPYGIRSLAPDQPGYRARFGGDRRTRDGAYHQGTVWPWLMGAFIDGWMRAWPEDRDGARTALEAMIPHLSGYCLGTIAEVFDADAPHNPGGCTAQGWSVAEWLRAWVRLEE